MKPLRLLLIAGAAVVLVGGGAVAAMTLVPPAPVHTGLFSDVGVSGYDPVAYFTDGNPARGDARFTATHEGVTYRFVSAEHQAAFEASPASYLPQYGGYCAWAVSRNYTAPADPTAWRIVDGKLYLNYNADIQRQWAGDVSGNISLADGNWPGVLSK